MKIDVSLRLKPSISITPGISHKTCLFHVDERDMDQTKENQSAREESNKYTTNKYQG